MNIQPKQIAGSVLIIAALAFGWTMDGVADVNQDHTLVAEFQRGTTPASEYPDVLARVVELLEANDNYIVRVVGHSGTRGPDESNMALSLERAGRAVEDLTRAGIDRDRIEGIGRGEDEPLLQGDHETDALWQKRLARVEFFVEVE